MLHDCCIYRPTFNIIISSSSSVISISDCVIDVLTFIVSLFCCSSSCGQVGVKIVLLIFWNFISESSIEFLKVYFKFTTDQSRFLSDIHAEVLKVQNFRHLRVVSVTFSLRLDLIRVTTDGTMVRTMVQVQLVVPRGFVGSAFSGNAEGVCNVLDSDRPGGEAARFCWRTLKGKKNLCVY